MLDFLFFFILLGFRFGRDLGGFCGRLRYFRSSEEGRGQGVYIGIFFLTCKEKFEKFSVIEYLRRYSANFGIGVRGSCRFCDDVQGSGRVAPLKDLFDAIFESSMIY